LKKINAFILDLDGVITNTAEFHYLAWKSLADEEEIVFTRKDNEALRGVSRRQSLEYLLGDRKQDYSEEQILKMMARKNEYYQEMLAEITEADFLPGAQSLLEELKQRGLKVAIGSASKNTRKVLSQLSILDFFDGIADGNMIVRAKPKPDVFIFAAGAIGVPVSNCVVVEDAESGIQAAITAGMTTVGVGPSERVNNAHFQYESTAHIDLIEILGRF